MGIKYCIEEISAHKWAKKNRVSYTIVLKLIKDGIPEDEIIRICRDKYFLKKPVEKAARKYLLDTKDLVTPKERIKAKQDYFNKCPSSIHFGREWEKMWEQLMNGEFRMDEKWKWIDSKTQVSNFGNARRLAKTGFFYRLTPFLTNHQSRSGGKLKHRLAITTEMRRIHVMKLLVAESFVPKPSLKHTCILLKDGNENNVAASNLEWITASECGKQTGFQSTSVELYATKGDKLYKFRSMSEASRVTGVSFHRIRRQLEGKHLRGSIEYDFSTSSTYKPRVWEVKRQNRW